MSGKTRGTAQAHCAGCRLEPVTRLGEVGLLGWLFWKHGVGGGLGTHGPGDGEKAC